MRRVLILVLLAAGAGLAACGGSDSGDGDEPAAAKSSTYVVPSREPPAAAAQPPAAQSGPAAPGSAGSARTEEEAGEPQHRQLMELMVWGGSGEARDELADADTCNDEVKSGAGSQRVRGLVVVQRWTQCMERLGWKRK